MSFGQDTPPSIQDGPLGYEPAQVDNFESIGGDEGDTLDVSLAAKLAVETYESSTNWLNAGRRARWNDSLRAFQSLHPSGSKYLSGDYRFRSSFFRPKSRAMVRRDEAATASAFFSNEDVVSIVAGDDDDVRQQASAEIMKELLQYRLADADEEDRIPWFLTVLGARQDAEVMGVCIAEVGWEYEERWLKTTMRAKDNGETEPVDHFKKIKDRPFIDLIAPENFRFEPGCDWRSVVRSSPYLIKLEPVYIQDALDKMESRRGAAAQWNPKAASELRTANDLSDDVTRRTRETGRVPGKDADAWKPRDFDICWTHVNIIRWGGRDWVYRTLGQTGRMLENPKPIEEVYLHGCRPFVVGSVILETHKTYPASKIELMVDLQRAANQDWNSRFDTIMLSLQPRQFVREGAQQDINDLRTFAPGKVVMVSGSKGEALTNQITWDRPPPVDSASFQEQNSINLDWDDLAGSFTNSSVQASQQTQQSATGMHLMSGEASGLNEYELRMFAETFAEPCLRLLIKTLQAYETDSVILALAGKRAGLMQRFGISAVTDELLDAGVTAKVNVGIGATNPQMKLRNFATGADLLSKMFGPSLVQGVNFEEVCKEVMGMCGFKDGERFFQPGFDPRVASLQQQLQQQQKGKGAQQGGQQDPFRLQAAQVQASSRIEEARLKTQADVQMAQMDYQTELMKEQSESQRQVASAHKDLLLAQHEIANRPAPIIKQGGQF